MRGVMPTGRAYDLEVTAERFSEKSIRTSANFRDSAERRVCRIDRTFHMEQPTVSPGIDMRHLNKENFVYGDTFRLDNCHSMGEFSRLIGLDADNPQRNILALGASSSIVFAAMDKGLLANPPGIWAFYTAQSTQIDTGLKPDPRRGIDLELYLSNRELFGKVCEDDEGKSKRVKMSIVGKTEGNVIYVTQSNLSFKEEGFLKDMFQRAIEVSKN
jgi:hypothetical protein